MRQVADDIAFPNAMAVTADNSPLIIAESCLPPPLGRLRHQRGRRAVRPAYLADLGDGAPEGICADTQNAVWYADVPSKRRVRIAEGGRCGPTMVRASSV